MTKQIIKAAILGATGYGGIELLRILSRHPNVEIVAASSENSAGKKLSEVFPHVTVKHDIILSKLQDAIKVPGIDVVFTALPNGEAMVIADEVLKSGVLIDLSADFRLKDEKIHAAFYKMKHESPHLIESAAYGLPELYADEIKSARLIANPGCYPTSILLSLVPLLEAGVIEVGGIIADSKSGVSGAGRTALKTPYIYAEANETMSAYAIGTHRHTPEIEQQLSKAGAGLAVMTFTPHLTPMTRGIYSTCYCNLAGDKITNDEILEIYNDKYFNRPFVKVLDIDTLPQTKWCSGSNNAFLTARIDRRTNRVITLCTIDNLGKGMSGQAVQNMNIVFGLPEDTGLFDIAIYP